MRISTLALAIVIVAFVLAIARDEIGRVAVIVFVTGVGTTASGVAAVMALFQTVGAFGEARTFSAHVEALAATILVVVVGSAAVLGVLFAGGVLVRWVLP